MKARFVYLFGLIIVVIFALALVAFLFLPGQKEALPPQESSTTASSPASSTPATTVIHGTLYSEDVRKGGPLIDSNVGVVFLNSDFFKTETGKPALEWFGKEVEAKGVLFTQKCGKFDQCAGDLMQSLSSIEYMKLATPK